MKEHSQGIMPLAVGRLGRTFGGSMRALGTGHCCWLPQTFAPHLFLGQHFLSLCTIAASLFCPVAVSELFRALRLVARAIVPRRYRSAALRPEGLFHLGALELVPLDRQGHQGRLRRRRSALECIPPASLIGVAAALVLQKVFGIVSCFIPWRAACSADTELVVLTKPEVRQQNRRFARDFIRLCTLILLP